MKNFPPPPPDVTELAEKIMAQLRPLLRGQGPYVQAAVLAEALACWLAGQPDFLREAVLTEHMKCVRSLVPVVELEIFGGGQHPQNTGQGRPS